MSLSRVEITKIPAGEILRCLRGAWKGRRLEVCQHWGYHRSPETGRNCYVLRARMIGVVDPQDYWLIPDYWELEDPWQ